MKCASISFFEVDNVLEGLTEDEEVLAASLNRRRTSVPLVAILAQTPFSSILILIEKYLGLLIIVT